MAGVRRYGKPAYGVESIDCGALLTLTKEPPRLPGGQEGTMASPSPAEDRDVAYPRLIELGIALSAEHNHARLLEKILLGAKELTNADGGTHYLVGDGGRELCFTMMRNDT